MFNNELKCEDPCWDDSVPAVSDVVFQLFLETVSAVACAAQCSCIRLCLHIIQIGGDVFLTVFCLFAC